jgi:hypothetical protein
MGDEEKQTFEPVYEHRRATGLNLGYSVEMDFPKNEIRLTAYDDPDPMKRTSREKAVLGMDQQETNMLTADRSSIGAWELRHRFGYHKPMNAAAVEMHRATREIFMSTALIFDRMLPEGRAKDETIERLEEACMWANKAIAEMSPVVDE